MSFFGTNPRPWCFRHIPKTAGFWTRDMLAHLGVKYSTLGSGGHDPVPEPPNTFVFSYVRHPLTFLQSWWGHRSSMSSNVVAHPKDYSKVSEYMLLHRFLQCTMDQYARGSFECFIKGLTQNEPGIVGRYFSAYVGTPENEINLIGRYETLKQSFSQALDLIGIKYDKRRINEYGPRNVTPGKKKTQAIYTPELKEMVLVAEADCISRFYSSSKG